MPKSKHKQKQRDDYEADDEDDDYEEEEEEDESREFEDTPKKENKKYPKEKLPTTDRYVPYHSPERVGVLDKVTNQPILEDDLTFKAWTMNKLQKIEDAVC